MKISKCLSCKPDRLDKLCWLNTFGFMELILTKFEYSHLSYRALQIACWLLSKEEITSDCFLRIKLYAAVAVIFVLKMEAFDDPNLTSLIGDISLLFFKQSQQASDDLNFLEKHLMRDLLQCPYRIFTVCPEKKE